jgi:uncharacterized phage protein gp47/JayE
MTLPIPTPQELAARFCAALDGMTFTATDGSQVTLDGRAPNTLENVLAAINAMSLYGLYLTMRQLALELMVTTATENGLLPQHAIMWNTPRRSPTAGIGNVLVSSSLEVIIPAGTEVTVDGSVRWMTTAPVTVAAGVNGTSIPVTAEVTGAAGNLAASTTLTLVSPIAGVTSIVVDDNGLAGGADLENVEAWRARIIANIRSPASGGSMADYQKWATAAGAPYVNVVPGWLGTNTVGVVVLMPGPTVPTPAQIAAIQAYVDGVRPVRANVTVVPGAIATQNPTVSLNPDTQNGRTQVEAAVAAYYAGIQMGGWLYTEELSAAIKSVAGETSFFISSPTADQQLPNNQAAVLGTITWGAVA